MIYPQALFSCLSPLPLLSTTSLQSWDGAAAPVCSAVRVCYTAQSPQEAAHGTWLLNSCPHCSTVSWSDSSRCLSCRISCLVPIVPGEAFKGKKWNVCESLIRIQILFILSDFCDFENEILRGASRALLLPTVVLWLSASGDRYIPEQEGVQAVRFLELFWKG